MEQSWVSRSSVLTASNLTLGNGGGGSRPAPQLRSSAAPRTRPLRAALLVLRLQTAALATGGPSAASATMPKAHSDDLAWRVVFRWHFLGQTYEEVCDVTHGLGVSRRYVDNVLKRFENSGDVATHQGQGADPMDKRALSRLEDWQIMRLIGPARDDRELPRLAWCPPPTDAGAPRTLALSYGAPPYAAR